MHNVARGGDPIDLGSCLSGLADQQQFQAWVSMNDLGLLDGHEVVYDTGAHRFSLVAPLEGEESNEPA